MPIIKMNLAAANAWASVAAVVGGNFVLDSASSACAGYPVYRHENDRRLYVCDLADRLELNLADGSSRNFWYCPILKGDYYEAD